MGEEKADLQTDVFVCRIWGGILELRVGDEVGVMSGGHFNRIPTIRRVVKVTHKGKRVRLDNGAEFNHKNDLVGSTVGYYRPSLIPVDEARRLMDPRQSESAMSLLLERVADTAREMKRHAAPLPAEKKAELMALVEKL